VASRGAGVEIGEGDGARIAGITISGVGHDSITVISLRRFLDVKSSGIDLVC
jgi:hypothetical protein